MNKMLIFGAIALLAVALLFLGNDSDEESPGPSMTVVPCKAVGENTITHAFMLPPGWQANCQTPYTLFNNLIVYHAQYIANKAGSDIELSNTGIERYNYDPKTMQMQKEIMDMSGGWSNPRLLQGYRELEQANQPPPQDFPNYAKQRAAEFMQQKGYMLYHLDRDPLTRNFVNLQMRQVQPQLRNNVHFDIVTAIGENGDSDILMVKMLLTVFQNQGFAHWSIASWGATAPKSKINEASDLIDLTLMTLQENIQHGLSIQRINDNYLRNQRVNSQIAQSQIANIYSEIGDMIHQGYQNRTRIQARGQGKAIDGIWELNEYRNPVDGSIVKAPIHNRYYYTNNMDDYIGTNNPMLNDEIGLTSMYNWTELQRVP